MKLVKIEYLTRNGERNIQVLEIIHKKNKTYTVRNPEDDSMTWVIPIKDVVAITEPEVHR